jgi:hypothetical protein
MYVQLAGEKRMPKVFKLSVAGLKSLIAEEKAALIEMGKVKSGFGLVGDVAKKAKETKEVDADEHGTEKVHEKDIDQLRAQKIQEAKLLMQLKKLREQMRLTKRRIEESHVARKPVRK